MEQAKRMKLFIPEKLLQDDSREKGYEVCIYLYDVVKSCHVVAGNEFLYFEV